MPTKKVAIAAVVVLIACQGPDAKPAASPSIEQSDFAAWEVGQLAELAQLQEFSGAVLMVIDGHVIIRDSVGLADVASSAPNTPQTKFRIGSLTKSFTAAAIMLLVQQGVLRLTSPFCQYVAACPDSWLGISVRNLLTHTSGIQDYLPAISLDQFTSPTPPEQIIELIRNRPLLFQPGAGFSYSNTNYVLLGLVIERITGLTWEAFVTDRILQPLHMRNTGYTRDYEHVPVHAVGYGFTTPGSPEIAPAARAAWADGGMYSTIDDLGLWAQAMARPGLFSDTSLAQMFAAWGGPGLQPADTTETYAYGWRIGRDNDGHLMFWHGGGIPGFAAVMRLFPDEHEVEILLSNYYFSDVLEIGDQLETNARTYQVWR